jgi:hypothetical protein
VDKEYNVENDNCGSLEIEKKLIKEGVKGKWGKKNIGDKLVEADRASTLRKE